MPAVEKEAYYTHDSIDRVASAWLGELQALRERRTSAPTPSQAALLVLDLQDYFADPDSHAFVPSLPAIFPRIEALIRLFATRDQPVLLTRHIDVPDPDAPMRRWWRDAIRLDEPRSELVEGLKTVGGRVLTKSQYDAFFETDLDEVLRGAGATQLVLCGVHAHLCCETTARSAFMRGYEVFVVVDGTATYNEALHRASLLNLAHGFAVPVLSREILSAWEGT